jgi:arylsulfatase A-like enzyme/Tfp pilus assembly protein PilF
VSDSSARIFFATFVLFTLSLQRGTAAQPTFPVVLITIDTLRADHLGCYGYTSIRTPAIDQLAHEGVRFTEAYTTVPITLPAHTALMTGEFPLMTGVHDFIGNKLPAGAVTLAKTLRDHGYSTAAFLGAAVLDSRFGLNQGFDTYFDHFEFGRLEEVHLDAIERRGDRVVDEALKWLSARPQPPFFLWVHLYDPHAPYHPPEPFATRYKARLYDGEIAYADTQVSRLMAYLRQHGLFENSLVVLASDHGESLGEHGEKTHGFFIYNATLHVPLIVKTPFKMPLAAPRVVTDEVSLVDVMPTVLAALNIPIPPSVQGRSLLNLVLGRPPAKASGTSNLYAESYAPRLHFGWNLLRSLEWGGLKYIETTRPELYDTRSDPRELHNLYGDRPAQAQEISARLHALVQRSTPAAATSPGAKETADPALLENLRSLGYVAFSAPDSTAGTAKALPDPKDRIGVYELVSAALADDQQGQYQESLRKLREAEKSEPNSLSILAPMARDYYHLADYPHATQYYQSALRLNPMDAIATYYLGLCRLQLGDLEGAENRFKSALALDPANFSAAFNLGVVYTRQHRAEEAIQAFQQAVRILPDYAEAHEALGELYLYLDRTGDAVRELERAVAIVPNMAKAHYQLGRAYAAQGLREKAQREFDRAKVGNRSRD